jgi:hypothetical protein
MTPASPRWRAGQRATAPYSANKNMGEIMHLECGQCHQRQVFILGVGMVYRSLENVLDCVPISERRVVRGCPGVVAKHRRVDRAGGGYCANASRIERVGSLP